MFFRKLVIGVSVFILLAATSACSIVSVPGTASSRLSTTTSQSMPASTIGGISTERETLIPKDAIKMSPETDQNPPLLFSSDYEPPVPVPGQVNTSGAEDSVFITPDGNTMYFFFTPDVNVTVEKQILDGVTGLYVSQKQNGEWVKPVRIILQDSGKLAMDGCEFVQDNIIWFCSAREGYTGIHWFSADYRDGEWQNWKNTDFNPDYQVGELHLSADWNKVYFHSKKPGGLGGLDIWVSNMGNGKWQEPVNVSAVNTAESEGWPALNPAEDELWFTRNWGVWRSKLVKGEWQEAKLIVSPLAGEASLDKDGNLYFVHQYYIDGKMIEADIYVAYRKK